VEPPDYSKAAAELASQLGALGYDDWRSRLEKAATSGRTSIDVVMEIRRNLREVMASKIDLPPEIRQRISSLFQELGRFLRS
jgi:hypothetical protein